MDVATAIRTRRSARDYSSRAVPASVLRDLIAAASWAPSAMNAQSWCFSVVTDTALLDDISRQAKAWLLDSVQDMPRPGPFRDLLSDPHFQLFYNAPALVVISSRDRQWAVEDCALAAQNMMLAAVARGVASCWIGFAQGWLNTDAGRQLLGLAADSQVVAPIILGYAKTPPPPVSRKTPIINWIGEMDPDLPPEGES